MDRISRHLADRLEAEPTLAPFGVEPMALAVLDSLTGRLCVLAVDGTIVAVNRAWRDSLQVEVGTPTWGGEGSNYLAACDSAKPADFPAGAAFGRSVRAVIEGRDVSVAVTCAAAQGRPAFTARISRFVGSGTGQVVVVHQDALLAPTSARRHVDKPGGAALRQRLLAHFGRKVLQDAQLDDLFTEAVSIAAEGLATEYADISLRESPDGPLVLRAGKGWQVGWIGRSVGGREDDTLGAAVMRERTAVVTSDRADDPRIRACALLSDHDVASGLAVPIIGTQTSGGPVGVLGAYSRRPHAFNPEQADFLQNIAHLLSTVIARHDADQKLARLAQFDALTGLPNRSLFQDRLSHGLAQARRHRWHTGVLFVDLDRFKTVNDTLGHDAGDDLLRQAAERLSACVRASDSVGRLAGDEFALVLNNVDWPDDAAVAAQRIVDTLARPFVLGAERVHLSASVGVAVFPDDADSPDGLMKSAEAAMHASKERGRRGYRFFVPQMTSAAIERQTLEGELREAIEFGQFRLHYQPKASLKTGRICGFEALLRWQHPERGLVAPLSFIGALEDSGLIVPVGEWVISEVCRQIVAWTDAGVPCGPVAVNLSARQFQTKDLDRAIVRRVVAAGVAPSMLEFELTESLLMVDTDAASQVLSRLKAAGFRLALDDFGTGYSSLAYLKRFPLDTLKIDRMFMRDVTADADGASIALAIIKLAQSLKLHVVAEGVESPAQLDFLRAHGCDEMQGYLLSRPMPAADCTRMLVEGRTL